MRRLVTRVQDLYARSERRPGSSCWWWLGGTSNGRATVWAVDLDRGEKRPMGGARAAWYVAYGWPLGADRVAYMRCANRMCVHPQHVAAGTRADVGAAVARSGILRVAELLPMRLANVARARAAAGIVATPAPIVLAIRAAPRTTSNVTLAGCYGLAHTTVARIRRGESRRHLLPDQEAA